MEIVGSTIIIGKWSRDLIIPHSFFSHACAMSDRSCCLSNVNTVAFHWMKQRQKLFISNLCCCRHDILVPILVSGKPEAAIREKGGHNLIHVKLNNKQQKTKRPVVNKQYDIWIIHSLKNTWLRRQNFSDHLMYTAVLFMKYGQARLFFHSLLIYSWKYVSPPLRSTLRLGFSRNNYRRQNVARQQHSSISAMKC